MTIQGKAFIAGAYEHPLRKIPDRSVAAIHAEVALGALADAGLAIDDVDAYFCDGMGGFGGVTIAEYLGLGLSYMDSTNTGGSSFLCHVGHAAAAIAEGKCHVALITLAGRPRTEGRNRPVYEHAPEYAFEEPYGLSTPGLYALSAARHMFEFGTTSADLAQVRVAASLHSQHNPNAVFQNPVTIEEVLDSPLIADPLHRLDCCLVTDGGGALVVVSPQVARSLSRESVKVLGHAEAVKHGASGASDLTYTAAVWTGPRALEEAAVNVGDIDYASIYDSFTITLLMTLEDLGFCPKGGGGKFVRDGALVAPGGTIPVNTDGGGLCNNHPANRGGMTKIIEAVRQLRGEAHPAVQVPSCELALAHGTGGNISTRSVSATLVLGRANG